jgi:glycerol-3-phosphate dehydrogenase subunit C
MYQEILKDDGYFSGFDPLDRIRLAEGIQDMGQYLNRCVAVKRLDTRFGAVPGRMVYFAPCHQREQEIGSPYETLLRMIPRLTVKRVGGTMDCCGMGGSLGFKESFYESSIRLGSSLMEKIEALSPDAVITDCLSCRLQFGHMLSYPVFHPMEILERACEAAEKQKRRVSGKETANKRRNPCG